MHTAHCIDLAGGRWALLRVLTQVHHDPTHPSGLSKQDVISIRPATADALASVAVKNGKLSARSAALPFALWTMLPLADVEEKRCCYTGVYM
jgi:hypothetical protein